jgi:hypothetical protein
MTPTLLAVREIYASMEQGNIGKLVVALKDDLWVYTADCMGGNRRGREGILQQVPAFYRPGTGIKKEADHFIEQGGLVLVLGNVQISVPGAAITSMPFADIWRFENNHIQSVIFYYRDPTVLNYYLGHN